MASDLGFQSLQAEDYGLHAGAGQFVLALQIVAFVQQLLALALQILGFLMQLPQACQQAVHLAAERLVILF